MLFRSFLILYVADHPDNTMQARRFEAVLKEAGVAAKAFGAKETNHNKLNEKLGVPDDPATTELSDFIAACLKK